MSTSLKVVSEAAVFCDCFRRSAILSLILFIFTYYPQEVTEEPRVSECQRDNTDVEGNCKRTLRSSRPSKLGLTSEGVSDLGAGG
jgi:hypothetical protein